LAVVVLVMIYTVVARVTSFIDTTVAAHSSETRLLIRSRWSTEQGFPPQYIKRIQQLPGIVDSTTWNYYLGFLDESAQEDKRVVGFATRMSNFKAMHPDLADIDPLHIEAMLRERTGALVSERIMEMMNWRVGQRFTVTSASHPGKNLEFQIVGTVPPREEYARSFFFHEDYFAEGTGERGRVSILWLRVNDPATGSRLASQIEHMFANHQPELKVETESATAARMIGRHQTLVSIINFVAMILLIDMAIVLSNSISIATQERRVEMAVMKVLGFQPFHIALLVIGEAMLVGALGGLLGAAVACGFSALNSWPGMPYQIEFFSKLPIGAHSIPLGFIYGALIGLAGSVLPAWNARRVNVADVFAKMP
jgi:putative ABC transport system permease protein